MRKGWLWLSVAMVGLAACSSTPPPPDWQVNAHGSAERAVTAYLTGNTRVETAEFQRARSEIAGTGRVDLVARAELLRCAAQVASLVLQPCETFEALRADATAADRAYANYLAGRVTSADFELLPPHHRAVAASAGSAAADAAAVQAISDPLARLVAAGVLLQAGRANPQVIAAALDTASAQGWRRPLLAWLKLQLQRAEQAGAKPEAEALRRRIALVESGGQSATSPQTALETAPRTTP